MHNVTCGVTALMNRMRMERLEAQIAELTKLKKGVQMTPGMPASVLVETGKRSVMGFLISPITDTLQDAFRDE